MVFLGWCFGSENSDIALSQPTNSWEIITTTWDTVMSWWVDTWVINTGKQESITTTPQQEVKDIVWTTIPQNRDTESFLSEYLAWEWLNKHDIAKQLSKNNIKVISMKKKDQASCEWYMNTECINFIIKDKTIVRSNAQLFIKSTKRCDIELKNTWSCESWWYPWDGTVYRFTAQWVLFRFWWGEWAACQWWWADRFTYVNFDEMKSFYSELSWQDKWVSPESNDKDCESKNTKRTKTEILRFYASNYDWNDEKKALLITAKTTEEAFYKYYKKQ